VLGEIVMWIVLGFFALLLIYPYALTIFELITEGKEKRAARGEKFRNWLKEVSPNETQRSAMWQILIFGFLIWGIFIR
jgi:hypothetical protein